MLKAASPSAFWISAYGSYRPAGAGLAARQPGVKLINTRTKGLGKTILGVTLVSKRNELINVLKSVAASGGIRSEVIVNVAIRSNMELDKETLDELVKLGYLRVRLVDKVILCPKCGSLSVLTKYACPRCTSINLVRSRLIQHLICGFTGSELDYLRSDYLRSNVGLRCPKCGTEIAEESRELKIYAAFFECGSCRHKMSAPNVLHTCHSCGSVFDPSSAVYMDVYSYELSDEGLKLIEK